MAVVSISKQLLNKVLLAYVLLTMTVMGVQVLFSYMSVKNDINAELKQLKHTIDDSLSQAIWELNDPQIDAIGKGLSDMKLVQAVLVIDEYGVTRYRSGLNSDDDIIQNTFEIGKIVEFQDYFGFHGDLTYGINDINTNNKGHDVGTITILSNYSNIYSAVIVQTMFPMIGALFSIFLISYVIKRLFHNLLTTPLEMLSYGISRINLTNLNQSKLDPPSGQNDELSVLTDSFNLLLDKLNEYKDNLEQAQSELVDANRRLDKQNLFLEQEVTKKTSTLSQANQELANQKAELEESEKELRHSLAQLTQTQNQLVQSEKMASLGSLVAGISHEINTPVGIGVTAVTYLSECVSTLSQEIDNKTLTQTKMKTFISDANHSCHLLTSNLNKASQLIQSFKDIAVDQTSEAIRDVNLVSYLNEVITSLQPKLKRTQHKIEVFGDEDIVLHCRAGALSQMFTNLILNSIVHAFDGIDKGVMTFEFKVDSDTVYINYKDNGNGISEDNLAMLFEPFFTTKRGQGGSGLGTHILYNIVTQSFNGEISARSAAGEGLEYAISFPIKQQN
ncbi:ATP-binding protein [Psychrobium sp. MM17-31]|uniref:ATP-binding protein n=1 Tax=Psychrobium sp. MM17-31 TaxID=2917758 RepID=UPI001EF452F7|nr:ATP-binding protein [Psychrobium sp. MM17-31]MCG7531250.1 ATP-binding protein [Psychrobium sp. MM17-31]